MLIKKALVDGKITPQQAGKYREEFIKALNEAIEKEDGLVMVKQAVLKGGVDDITKRIKREITK